MIFNRHSELVGNHAFLGASKYHWTNYTDEKVTSAYLRFLAVQKGTELHDFASRCVVLKQKLPRNKKSLNAFVNDAIGYRMKSEQPLFYSINSFGTADAISFRDGLLRIHDLKTGVTPASLRQTEVYAALFCLEYDINPKDISMELRIYQSDEVLIHNPDPNDILQIMNKIIAFDQKIEQLKHEMED